MRGQSSEEGCEERTRADVSAHCRVGLPAPLRAVPLVADVGILWRLGCCCWSLSWFEHCPLSGTLLCCVGHHIS